jgi:CO/xanthine dehydrogenase FAD-binding subunit
LDLPGVTAIDIPRSRKDLGSWRDGDAWLGGGTWLFSEPQPALRRLVDLCGLGWTPMTRSPAGLRIAATCSIAELAAAKLPGNWRAAPLIEQCCQALLGSFKIWNAATVGGNICLALPAGPMTALAVALEAVGTIWTTDGGERTLPIEAIVTGPRTISLRPAEILREIAIPAEALGRRTAFRRISLSQQGRSAALVIATRGGGDNQGKPAIGRARRPVRMTFEAVPGAERLQQHLTLAIPHDLYYDDVHGTPNWRRHMTLLFAEQVRAELEATG